MKTDPPEKSTLRECTHKYKHPKDESKSLPLNGFKDIMFIEKTKANDQNRSKEDSSRPVNLLRKNQYVDDDQYGY